MLKSILKKVPFLLESKRTIQRGWHRFLILTFGNGRPLRTNLLYKTHHLYCMLRSKTGRDMSKEAILLKEKGYVILPFKSEWAALAEKVDQKLEKLYQEKKYDQGLANKDPSFIQINDCLNNAPEIENFIDETVIKTIEGLYKSHFRFYRVRMYRTLPKEESYDKLKNAWRWHTDDYPHSVRKIMVYLTDSDDKSGAFRAHSYVSSKQLYKEGFFDRYRSNEFIQKLEDKHRYEWVGGPRGTVAIFDNNLVHRATPPQEPFHRDVVVFELVPSPRPWPTYFTSDKDMLSKETKHSFSKYPKNPFRFL